MKRSTLGIISIASCLSVAISTLVGTYGYYTYNEEIVNQIQIIIPNTRSLLATLSNATLSNATSSNWIDTDVEDDELEWLRGDNVELINDLS